MRLGLVSRGLARSGRRGETRVREVLRGEEGEGLARQRR